jgi:uncharacterized membrane protein
MTPTWTLAALSVGPIQFDNPRLLWIYPVVAVLSVLIARKSLSGLGNITRWVALGTRLLVLALIVGALAEPSWRKESKSVAVTVLVDVSDSIPAADQKLAEKYLQAAAAGSKREPEDKLGVITMAREPYVQQLTSKVASTIERGFTGKTDATDIAAAVRLALGIAPADSANKLILVSDGNETVGSVLAAIAAAQAANIPISIYPIRYRYDSEVLMERLVVPPTARVGENVSLKVVLNATTPASGTLFVRDDSGPIDLDPASDKSGVRVQLEKGPNTFAVSVPVLNRGAVRFEATFEPDSNAGAMIADTRIENNRQIAVTFVSGEGSVLVIREDPSETNAFVRALKEFGIPVSETDVAGAPRDMVQMNAFDAIVLANVPRTLFTEQQIADLQRYVREGGGGLVMLGGNNSMGAGIWMDTPVAETLPVDLNPPQKKEMPRGALGIWCHSVEMPDGRFLGGRVCNAAVDALSRLDYAGIAEWGPTGAGWAHPMSPLGDKTKIKQAINRLTYGDMTDWTPALQALLAGMENVDAGQKHCILISDGDPMAPSRALLDKFRNSVPPISITTVAIACHGIQDQTVMENIARYTGGRFYKINPGQENKVPEIFIKEAITIHRPLIREGKAFTPKISGISSETFAGISSLPGVTGYIRVAERGGLALVTLKNDEDEPLMAQWNYGLGRSIAYTSDAGGKWATQWPSWGQYAAFWSQHIRWVMRPTNSAVAVRVTPETKGDETLLIVEASTREGERLPFVNFQGRIASPDGMADQDIVLREIGPGRYEGRVRTAGAGTYIASLRYRIPRGDGGPPLEGSASAAINRPFADEYRTLKDNAVLLDQVRDKTSGLTLPRDPAAADLWNREKLAFPVSTHPIWLLVSTIAIALFLVDVAVRRVRIDILGMAAAVRRAAGKDKKQQAELSGLRAARDKAKASIKTRADTLTPIPAPMMPLEPGVAGAKFDATDEELRAARKDTKSDVPGAAPADPSKPASKPKSAKEDAEQGMSALLKAKRRARDEFEDR